MEMAKNQIWPTTKTRKKVSDRLFKTQNPDVYYEHLHIEYYYFYQECEDYFEIIGVKTYYQVSFATFFLKKKFSPTGNSLRPRSNAIA